MHIPEGMFPHAAAKMSFERPFATLCISAASSVVVPSETNFALRL